MLSYGYDGAGNLASMSSNHVNGILVQFAYDELNRLSTVVDNRLQGNQTTTYTYDPASNVATVTAPNGLQTTLSYDPMNRLTSLTTPISSYTYTLGATGSRTGVTEGKRTCNQLELRQYLSPHERDDQQRFSQQWQCELFVGPCR